MRQKFGLLLSGISYFLLFEVKISGNPGSGKDVGIFGLYLVPVRTVTWDCPAVQVLG